MIRMEEMTINGRAFVRTYSDANRYVVRDGISYSDAVDPAEFGRTYAEGEVIETKRLTETEEKARAFDILTGVSE